MYFKYVFQLLVFQLLHNIAVCTLTVSGQHEVPGSLFREREREREIPLEITTEVTFVTATGYNPATFA